MTGEGTWPLVWPALVVAVLLAGLTGFVDAIAFDRFLGVFVANQSGNAVFLGMAIGGSSVSTVWRPLTAMVGFALGIVLGQLVRQRVPRRRLGAWLLACELALFVVVIVITGPIDRVHLIGGGEGVAADRAHEHGHGGADRGDPPRRRDRGGHHLPDRRDRPDGRGGEPRAAAAPCGCGRSASSPSSWRVLAAYVGGAALGAASPGTWRWSMVLAAAVVGLTAASGSSPPSGSSATSKRHNEHVHAAAMSFDLHVPESRSLKAKRAAIRPIVDGLRHRFRISVAETGHLDQWQRAEIAVAIVAESDGRVQTLLDGVERFVAAAPAIELLAIETTWLEVERVTAASRRVATRGWRGSTRSCARPSATSWSGSTTRDSAWSRSPAST